MDFMRDHHERRMAKLEEMIQDRKSALEDHEAGTRRLNEDDHARFTRQVTNFERKLERMKEMNSDEHHAGSSHLTCNRQKPDS